MADQGTRHSSGRRTNGRAGPAVADDATNDRARCCADRGASFRPCARREGCDHCSRNYQLPHGFNPSRSRSRHMKLFTPPSRPEVEVRYGNVDATVRLMHAVSAKTRCAHCALSIERPSERRSPFGHLPPAVTATGALPPETTGAYRKGPKQNGTNPQGLVPFRYPAPQPSFWIWTSMTSLPTRGDPGHLRPNRSAMASDEGRQAFIHSSSSC